MSFIVNDCYDPRILSRRDEEMSLYTGKGNPHYNGANSQSNTPGCDPGTAQIRSVDQLAKEKDNHPVAVVLDGLVAAVNEIEDTVNNLSDRIEPVLTPVNCQTIQPSGNVPAATPVRTSSPLVDSIQGQLDRLLSISAKARRLTGRVEL